MRDLSASQHKALDRINRLATVIGWCGERQGPILRAGSMEVVLKPDGTVEAR